MHRRLVGLIVLGAVLAGCASQGGLLGSGLYKANVFRGGVPVREGMTYQDVRTAMGPSYQPLASGRAEVWRYGVNILGMIGPSCTGTSSDLGCIDVYFYDGRVVNIVR